MTEDVTRKDKGARTALITGVLGMDGSHLADFLLNKGYRVYGLARRSSREGTSNVSHLEGNARFSILAGDLTDQNSLVRALKLAEPDEVYNLAAQSFVGESWNTPEYTGNVTGLGVLRMLEAVREHGKPVRFYQASSSEMFGQMTGVQSSCDEGDAHPPLFHPRSPYGVAKLYGHWITRNYRESYGMFAVSGILFNHESERRGPEFVTRKITRAVAMIHAGRADHVALGNLDAKRDWGYAPDYVEAMWLMLQPDTPRDYVVATGVTRSVRDFLSAAFSVIGVEDWSPHVRIDPRFFRPAEVDVLRGDASRIRQDLGWEPKTAFEEWVRRMVRWDIADVG